MEDALYAVGVAALFFLGWFFSNGSNWALFVLLGYVLGLEWRAKRRMSRLEEQLAELKASQTESRGGIAQ